MSAGRIQTTKEVDDDQNAIEALLGQIVRYRLSTFAAMARLPEFNDESPRRLRRLLRHCRNAGLLSSAALHSGMRYWFLTQVGASHCGLNESRSGPLSETAKLRAFALLLFCCMSPRPRYRLTAAELSERFSILHRTGMPGTYYLNPTDSGCIGLARVDAGHHGRWDRVVQSVRDDISLHRKLPGFRQLIKARRFENTVLTVLSTKADRTDSALNPVVVASVPPDSPSTKADRTDSALKALPEVKHVPVHVVAQPELLPLIHSSHGKDIESRLPHHGFYRSRPRSKEKQRAGNLSHRRQN